MTEPRRIDRASAASGFTLIELMIALVVIAIGVIALSGVQTRSSRDVYSSGRQTRALALAQERIEIARGAGYFNAVADSGSSAPYTWATQVDSVGIELREVIVNVSWPEQAQTRTLQLNTLLSRR